MTDPALQTFQNWTFRLRRTQSRPERLLLLLHGWMGDENSMWVLTRDIPQEYMLLAPRAPYPVPAGGYSWRNTIPTFEKLSAIGDLEPSARALLEFVDNWCASEGLEPYRLDLMGFSQGAAIIYTLALNFPARVDKLAILSGFIPTGAEDLLARSPLAGRSVYIAHGRQDERVPVEHARQAVEALKQAGARVDYCESDAGHKVSKDCLKGMGSFFKGN